MKLFVVCLALLPVFGLGYPTNGGDSNVSGGSSSGGGSSGKCRFLNPEKDAVLTEDSAKACGFGTPGIDLIDGCDCKYLVKDRDPDGCPNSYSVTCTLDPALAPPPVEEAKKPAAPEKTEFSTDQDKGNVIEQVIVPPGTPCAQAVDMLVGQGGVVPLCTPDGNYEVVQCDNSCFCVDPVTGEEIGGTRVDLGIPDCVPEPPATQPPPPPQTEAPTPPPETAPPATQPPTPPPQTDPPATQPPTPPPQTDPPATEPPATEPPATEPPTTTQPPATEPPTTTVPPTEAPATEPPTTVPPTTTQPPATEPPATEPAPTANTPCFDERTEVFSNGLMVGMFVPACTDNGLYEALQCSGSTGQCWCVDEQTGEKLTTDEPAPGTLPSCAPVLIVEEPDTVPDPPPMEPDVPEVLPAIDPAPVDVVPSGYGK